VIDIEIIENLVTGRDNTHRNFNMFSPRPGTVGGGSSVYETTSQ
jgi:hypothetical protein